MLHRRAVLLLVAVVAGTAFRLWGLGSSSLWTDEGVSWALAVRDATTYEHPPFYIWLLRVFIRTGLDSEWGMRLASALPGIALIPVVYAVGTRLLSAGDGLVACALVSVNPCLLMVSQEARMYSVISLAGALSILAFVEVLRSSHKGWRLLWVASSWVLVTSHHVGWLLVLPQLVWLLARGEGGRRRESVLLGCALLLLYAPVLPRSAEQIIGRLRQPSGGFLQSGLDGAVRIGAVLYRMGAGYALPSGRSWLVLAGTPLILVLLGAVRTARRPFVVGVLTLWLLPVVAFVAFEGSPANVATQAAGAYALLAAAGVRQAGRARLLLVLLLVAGWGAGAWSYYDSAGYPLHPEDWRSLARHLERHCEENDLIYLTGSRNSYFTFDYYYRGACKFACRVPDQQLYEMEARPRQGGPQVRAAVEKWLDTHPVVWLVYVDWGLPAIHREIHQLDEDYLTWEASFGRGLRLKRYATAG